MTGTEDPRADAPENEAPNAETPTNEAPANETAAAEKSAVEAAAAPSDESDPIVPAAPDAAPMEQAAAEANPEAAAAEPVAEDVIPDPDEFVTEVNDNAGIDNVIEALLLASETPLSFDSLQRLIGEDFNAGRNELRASLNRLNERYAFTAMQLHEVAGGWRIQVRQEHAHWVARLYQEKPPKLSRATLETLALIVYRQPITRGEIESVRGVAVSSNILRTLLERGWIREVGHKEAPGRPALFGTTQLFLDDFNIKSLDQLPSLPEIKDADQLEAALARLAPQMAQGAAEAEEGDEAEAVNELAGDDADGEGTPQDATVH